ncbi:MAG: membrane protein insertion efficiency factor YidD [Verrucomicrobia bacterium]|nr:membrane protein insertion efficiency factor YidD [Verrucomicrobiota bacterium]
MRKSLLFLIRFYQLAISPHLGRWCRFHPSCSEYTRQAVMLHGLRRGLLLAGRRLARCHPFCEGGFDPVPASTMRAAPQTPHRMPSPTVLDCASEPPG